jgi:CRISPR/Cas system-associated protein Csm6
MIKIITSVGTSMITNRSTNTRGLQDCNAKQWDSVSNAIATLKNEIKSHQDFKKPNSSAEIQSLESLRQKYPDQHLEVHLLASDTVLSRLAAELIQDWFTSKTNITIHFDPSKDVIAGLQIKDYDQFRNSGMLNLIARINELKTQHEGEAILNISGGYKGVLPILTIYGQLYGLKLIYQYEDSPALIEIDRMPLSFDWDVIEEYVELIKRENKRNDASPEQLNGMRALHIIEQEGTALTILGKLLADYLDRASPFTSTIMGYFIEHKLDACYGEHYGKDKVVQGYQLEEKKYGQIGDIDLLIETENQLITAEVKHANFLSNNQHVEKLAEKIVSRSKGVNQEEKKEIKEIWLIVYSYHADNREVWIPDDDQNRSMYILAKTVHHSSEFSKVPVVIKHFKIVKNKLTGGERHIYQVFMKNRLKLDQIKDIKTYTN